LFVPQMPFDLEKTLQSVASVKLSGGVVGRVCQVVMVVSICFVALAAWSDNLWIKAGGIAAVFLFAFPLLWRAVNFAERNPYAAMLDGGELLLHQRMMLGTKAQPTLPATPEVTVEETAVTEAVRIGDGPPQARLEQQAQDLAPEGE
jgi:hypothetical protein